MEIPNLKYQKSKGKNDSGYTLIEILVALTIIGLLFSFGYVSFRDFSRRQAVSSAAKMVEGDLRLTQADAITGQKPDGCNTTLESYSFNVRSSSRYTIEANCAATPIIVKDVNLPSGITISPLPGLLKFKVLSQGTNIGAGNWVLTLTQTGTGNIAKVIVTSGGEIKSEYSLSVSTPTPSAAPSPTPSSVPSPTPSSTPTPSPTGVQYYGCHSGFCQVISGPPYCDPNYGPDGSCGGQCGNHGHPQHECI
jgi:prepilin-type N-terminal cleavage/methylation domain-containing protein